MILVTGGTGLVGSHLLFSLLSDGYEVRAFKRDSSNTNNVLKVFNYYTDDAQSLFDRIQWLDMDLDDVTQLHDGFEGITEVYHCAAMVSFLPRDARHMIRYNPLITANMVDASIEAGVEKFCLVSSVAALAKREGELTTENDIWKTDRGNSAYAISKYLSEMEVWRGIEEGLNATMVNPSLILGPGNWEATSSTLFDRAYKGMPFYTEGANAFVDVRDVVAIMRELMQKNIFSKRFIVSAENWLLKDFFTMAAQELGSKPPSIKPPKWVIPIIYNFEWVRSNLFNVKPFITRESAQSAQKNIMYDSSRIQNEIGFQFRSVEASIKEFAAFYLEDLKKN